MTSSTSLLKIAPALLASQKAIGSAKKDAKNPFFKSTYANLGSVMEACKEHLNDNGITVLQPVGTDEAGVYIETILLHESGEYISDKMRLAVKSNNNPQDLGSAISYGRRYSLQSMVFIPAEDDDGERATNHNQPAKPIIKVRDDGFTAELTNDHQPEQEEVLQCEACGEPANEKRGKTKVGNKPYHGIFCTSADKTHTKWLKD